MKSNPKQADVSWFEEHLIPKILKSFGNNVELVQYNLTALEFMCLSRIYYLDLTYRDEGKCKKISTVVKRASARKEVQKFIHAESLFHNEILFYNEIGKGNDNFPRCIYLAEQPMDDTVIVMENVTIEHDYYPCKDIFDAQPEYVLVAVQELSRFHGMAYVMKERNPDKFFKLIGQLRDHRYAEANKDTFGQYTDILLDRQLKLIRPLIKDNNFYNAVETLLKDAFLNVLIRCTTPREPLAVLCHGDYTMNNVLFKEVNGSVQAKLIDFAMLSYSSPATDLSTLVYLSCTSEFRRKNFSTIFKTYHDTLLDYLRENGIENLDKYSYEAFREDYVQHEIFGAVIANFFSVIARYTKQMPIEDMVVTSNIELLVDKICECDKDFLRQSLLDLLAELENSGCLQRHLKWDFSRNCSRRFASNENKSLS